MIDADHRLRLDDLQSLAIDNKRLCDRDRFEDNITVTIDDTDFAYRLSKFPEMRFGVGHTKIRQYHFSNFRTYVKKFQWYGKGDGEFCRKQPVRAASLIFHLLVRYIFLHSGRTLFRGYFRAVPFFVLQGTMRFVGLTKYFLGLKARS